MPPPRRIRTAGLVLMLCIFAGSFLFTTRHMNTAMAADDRKLWVDEDWNILALVPEGWEWKEDFGNDIPVVFLPSDKEDKGIPDFVFVSYLGKQGGKNLEEVKEVYLETRSEELDNFKLNSTEQVSSIEGLNGLDMSYTFTEEGKPVLGYDRLVATDENIYWAISFSADNKDFKKLKNDAISIIDSFVFDAAKWLEDRQKNKDK